MISGVFPRISAQLQKTASLYRPYLVHSNVFRATCSPSYLHRGYSTSVTSSQSPNLISVALSKSENQKLNPVWLRENCRCEECFNHSTQQRNKLYYELQSREVLVENTTVGDETLTVSWGDGHQSQFSCEWLKQHMNVGKDHAVARVLWDVEKVSGEEIPRVEFSEFVTNDETQKVFFGSLLKYGFALVDGVPPSLEGTQKTAETVCFIQETFFGGMWSFTANMAHEDTAFTNIALGAHTDSTYFSIPTGIQVFHCLHHDGEGGETLLVDGFHAAEDLRKSHPDYFSLLTKQRVKHHYLESKVHMSSFEPILKTRPITDQMEWIRYNHYDRAPLQAIPQDEIAIFYDALAALSKRITDPSREFWLKLRPGTVLFVDNWRVLHGRAAFTGNRRIGGCYLPRDDWLSRARVFGLA